ncbi:MAG TPA: group III truncated hemoglobin [Paracoccaceae bacterium]|nr:group III truncated hemoglobin [Paracoccaceae bacterium]
MQATAIQSPDHRAHVEAIRLRKQSEAAAIGIDAELVGRVVEHFYTRVRADELLGPIFAEKITDWPVHLGRMKQFWRSVLLGTGEFSGNPMVRHQGIPSLEERHFAHWLDLFYQTLREECEQAEGVAEYGARARMIAESLLIGIEMRRDGLTPHAPKRSLPHV